MWILNKTSQRFRHEPIRIQWNVTDEFCFEGLSTRAVPTKNHKPSMYGIYLPIFPINNQPNVGKYTIHG